MLLSSKITVETKRKTPVSVSIRSQEIPIEVTQLNMLQDKKSSVHNFKIQKKACKQAIDISEVKSIGIIFFSSVLSLVRVHESRSKSPNILKSVDGDANPSSKQTNKQTSNNYLQYYVCTSSLYDNGDYLPVLCLFL